MPMSTQASPFYRGPLEGPGMNEIEILTEDRDHWKALAIKLEARVKELEEILLSALANDAQQMGMYGEPQ